MILNTRVNGRSEVINRLSSFFLFTKYYNEINFNDNLNKHLNVDVIQSKTVWSSVIRLVFFRNLDLVQLENTLKIP